MLMEMGIIALSVIAAWSIAFMALRYAFKPKEEKPEIPYWFRNGMEDVIAPNANMRVMLRNLQDFIDLVEWDLERQAELIGQIRNGEYEKDQPRSQRAPTNDATD